MHFGLKNTSQIFQRRMDKIFKQFHEFCIVYVDDILIFSNNEVDHSNHLISFAENARNVEYYFIKEKLR